jgi:myo-inositol-1(or 4)-monophosphatase
MNAVNPEFIKTCEEAARAGGAVLLDWQGKFNVREKGVADLVTEADLASQEKIRSILLGKFPDHAFIGEEDTSHEEAEKLAPDQFRWICDPLDGTTNYVHALPLFSVSIALEQAGQVIVGTVLDPVHDECFSAVRGGGAFLNGSPIQTSRVDTLSEALAAASFSPRVDADSPQIAQFLAVLQKSQAVRRLGSAALNLAYLASGRLDAYWASSVKTWDVAAGILLLEEAGGVLSGIDGGPFDLAEPRFAASAGEKLHAELLDALNGAS